MITHHQLMQTVCCVLLLTLLSQTPCAVARKCQLTEIGYQPHSRDCGPMAKGCRIVVKPYKTQNNSAVAACRSDERPGDFVFDCAVECKDSQDDYWNEVVCCSDEENCNGNLDDINKKNYCYVSKPNSDQLDRIVICSDSQKCALNSQTQETLCVDEAQCQGGEYVCCPSKSNCGHTFGIYKPDSGSKEEEAQVGHRIEASLIMTLLTVVIVSLLTAR